MAALELPRNLIPDQGRPGWPEWLGQTLPAAVTAACERWSLVAGPPFQPGGETSWVAPVTGPAGDRLVLKVTLPHPEAAGEAAGLAAWAGQGTVRLAGTADFPGATALLIERCQPGTLLRRRPRREQDTIVAGLLRRLWIEPAAGLGVPSLQQMCEYWADRFEQRAAATAATPPAPASPDLGLARAGIALLRELPANAPRRVLLATDLHAGNVLRAGREPWLVIDPKPHTGDPAYDLLQHMLNCPQRLHRDPAGLAARMAGLAGLDPDRVRRWLFARCVQQAQTWPALQPVARRLAPG
jgi:streptomycin 6-kinase